MSFLHIKTVDNNGTLTVEDDRDRILVTLSSAGHTPEGSVSLDDQLAAIEEIETTTEETISSYECSTLRGKPAFKNWADNVRFQLAKRRLRDFLGESRNVSDATVIRMMVVVAMETLKAVKNEKAPRPTLQDTLKLLDQMS